LKKKKRRRKKKNIVLLKKEIFKIRKKGIKIDRNKEI